MNNPEFPAANPPLATTLAFRLALAWIIASAMAFVINLAPIAAAMVNNQYIPIGPDSFYHARRILDAVADPGSFFQFDAHMHAPAGAIVSWPWGYDYLMSLLVRAGLALGISQDPLAILAHIPVFTMPLTLLLVIVICRTLNLSFPATVLALLGTVLFPLNQPLYSIGNIDHHYVEHLLVTASLAVGLRWLAKPDSATRAIAAGIVIGIAPAVHTGEFILQIPVLATLGFMWLRGTALPSTVRAFATALLLTSLLIALPSLAFRRGMFDFLTLSWFQVYIALCTSLLCVYMKRFACSRNTLVALVALSVLLAIPVASQALEAGRFLTSTIEGIEDISETRSIFGLLERGHSTAFVFGFYTYLIVLIPLILVLCIWKLFHDQSGTRALLWVSSSLGLLLLLAQIRLHYFGSFALFLPLLVWLDEKLPRLAMKPALSWTLAGVVFLAACSTGPRQRFFQKQVVGGDPDYSLNRGLFLSFAEVCAQKPGVVLAHPHDGNYLRFHTDCDVLGTNFLLTRQDITANRDARALFYLPATKIPEVRPDIEYLFIRHDTQFTVRPDGMLILDPDNPHLSDPPLVRELLNADLSKLPAQYRLVDELRYEGQPPIAYARVFAIER